MTHNDENDHAIPKWAYEEVQVVSPNPFWEKQAIEWKDEVRKLLKPLGIEQIEHIGSTSILELPAKPIIDLIARVPKFKMTDELITNLENHDWHYVPPELDLRNWRRFFVKVNNDKRIAHLHLFLNGERRWDEYLQFRDALRSDPQLVAEYGSLKEENVKRYSDDREKYTESKAEFIQNVLVNYGK